MDRFSYINIREYLIQEDPNGIGEADLLEAISDFSCPKNLDVECFLKNNAIDFTKKNQQIGRDYRYIYSCGFFDCSAWKEFYGSIE